MKIALLEIVKHSNHRIQYDFYVSPEIRKYFDFSAEFFIEYSEDISSVPNSILTIPFLANVLPIAWVVGAEVVVPELDRDFYEAVPDIKQSYINMYPMIGFGGCLTARTIYEEKCARCGRPIAFFSGGVDAHNTMIQHMDEKPVLATIWGSDVFFGDREGWQNVLRHAEGTAETFGLELVTIKSNFRGFLDERKLSKHVSESGCGWWFGFQHGMGIISHAAPLAWLKGADTVYIASSDSAKDLYLEPCGSCPDIDEKMRFGGVSVIHDGFEISRQDKVENIVSFVNKNKIPLFLRVCWQEAGGKNCGHCEKCMRTIMGLIAAGADPEAYGLPYTAEGVAALKKIMRRKITKGKYFLWLFIWESFVANNRHQDHPELKWFADIDFRDTKQVVADKKWSMMWRKMRQRIKRIYKKREP